MEFQELEAKALKLSLKERRQLMHSLSVSIEQETCQNTKIENIVADPEYYLKTLNLKLRYEEGEILLKALIKQYCQEDYDNRIFYTFPIDLGDNFKIAMPGKKDALGDYQFTEKGVPRTYKYLINQVYLHTDWSNVQKSVDFLEDVYKNGMQAENNFFDETFKKKLFWITLQEDINYPARLGRKLPFRLCFEAALLERHDSLTIENIVRRIPGNGTPPPPLWDLEEKGFNLEDIPDFCIPDFYK